MLNSYALRAKLVSTLFHLIWNARCFAGVCSKKEDRLTPLKGNLMKSFILAFCATFMLGTTTFANQITIDGQKAQYKTQTTAEVTHTEYRQEEQDSTCSRQIPIGSHQECRQVGGGQSCYDVGGGEECHDEGGGEECEEVGGGQECHEVGGGQSCGETPSGRQCFDLPGHQECGLVPGHRECYQTPSHRVCSQLPGHEVCTSNPSHEECNTVTDYKTEYYSCTETVNVPYTVKDSEIENSVVVNVEIKLSLPSGLKEVIDLVQTPTALTLKSVKSTAKVLVYATQTSKVISDNGRLKKLETVVSIKMIDRNLALGAFLSPLGELTADNNGLKITMGPVADPTTVRFDLTIKRNKLLGKDEVVIQRALTINEVAYAASGNQTIASVDFAKLGIQDKIKGKKVKISLQVQPNVSVDSVVNTQDVPAGLGGKKELETRLK